MSHDETSRTDRRTFLQAGALATAAALGAASGAEAQDAAAKAPVLPKRKLGKTGVEITMLEMGTGALRERGVLDRLLRLSFASGVRTFDTAKAVRHRARLQEVVRAGRPRSASRSSWSPRTSPSAPKQMLAMLDERLAALGTDYVDLFFIHGLGDDHSLDEAINFVKSQEFKETADAIRKSGKAKFLGFSTHHKDRAQIIQAAAEGGIVDAIMLQYTPWLDKDSPLNKALDACHEKGIGLISMKQIAGQFPGAAQGEHPRGGRPAGADARREEADALPGPAARDLDRRADQRLVRLDARPPTRSARTPTPPAASSR